VVDAGTGRREAVEPAEDLRTVRVDVEVARDDAEILPCEAARPMDGTLDLRLRNPHVTRVRGVEVDEQRAALDPDGDRLAALLRPRELPNDRQAETAPDLQAKAERIQRQEMPGQDRATHEDRVGLPFESGTKEARVEIGEVPTELGSRREWPDRRSRGHPPEDVHPAPLPEPLERPWRHLLEADRVRLTGARQAHHLFHVALPPGRKRVAVEDVPGPDDHGTTLGCVPGRFAELIDRQLRLFQQEDAEFLARVDEAERAYDRADREEAEEVFGRFQELVEFGTETLAEMRYSYAATLDEDAAEEYVAAFNEAVRRRLPRFALEIDEL
jgi:hypothetical protein